MNTGEFWIKDMDARAYSETVKAFVFIYSLILKSTHFIGNTVIVYVAKAVLACAA